ncbi:uncharacterized protein BDR25DRAFT_317532 [Lindgomyces ingoldianus]|uniref:Uncharacterized protein n=1 Tax=Lindgomyces ingoldianus TaxID=673940 RepID=A0ACB6QIU1_9PLEO|nr:uncharacterized protein BDR25DRAFT_317532 [Lindgomyces ingoldianus]KAF2466508.1 hypothetical protein BDR25DRAFT_317532 [Lindgomyces ingoldianus]
METEVSPRSLNPLRNKILHADIRFGSIEDGGRYEGEASQNSCLSQDSTPPEDAAAQERAAEMQMWWDEAIAKNMNLPDGYQKVAVLLIKWADQLDELKTRDEALELDAVFRKEFHFHTEIVELNVSSKPQHQMNRHLSAFVEKHDGPNNLLIVYYTGHGVYREDGKFLELTGSINPTVKKGFNNDARANWDKAEEALRSEYVEGDVLTILDTCYSSNLQKSGKEDTRTFELLSACAFDSTTASPGENSFTRALIDALKELLQEFEDRSFTTFHLNQRILLNPNRRDTPSQLWFRLKHHERHIRLAPLKPEKERARKPSLRHPPKGYLTLRFALRDESLNREQIEYLTRNLSKAFNNKALVGLRRIDWLGLKPARTTHFGRAALAMFAIAQWKKFVKKRREEMRQNRRVDEINIPVEDVSMEETLHRTESTTSSPTRKRSREDVDEMPGAKRELLVTPQFQGSPPSPPVSDSS